MTSSSYPHERIEKSGQLTWCWFRQLRGQRRPKDSSVKSHLNVACIIDIASGEFPVDECHLRHFLDAHIRLTVQGHCNGLANKFLYLFTLKNFLSLQII